MRRPPLTKDRLQAIIDTLNEALTKQHPLDRRDYKGALDWAIGQKALTYRETQP